MTRFAAIVLSASLLLATAAATDQTQLSKKEVMALIANATTPADHRRLAAYYRDEAQRLEEMRQEHLEMAAEYEKNPWKYSSKYPTPAQHCRSLSANYSQAAKKALALAEDHESMAKKAENRRSD